MSNQHSNTTSDGEKPSIDFYREQHKLRLSYMPWLYFSLKSEHKTWAQLWQKHLQGNDIGAAVAGDKKKREKLGFIANFSYGNSEGRTQ